MSDPRAGARDQIAEVLEDLERVMDKLRGALGVIDGTSVTVHGRGTWSVGSLTSFWQLSEGLPGPRTLIRECSARAGTWVSFGEIAEIANLELDQLRNELARFSRMLNDASVEARPYETRQVAELGYKSGYRIPVPIADLFHQVLEITEGDSDGS